MYNNKLKFPSTVFMKIIIIDAALLVSKVWARHNCTKVVNFHCNFYFIKEHSNFYNYRTYSTEIRGLMGYILLHIKNFMKYSYNSF